MINLPKEVKLGSHTYTVIFPYTFTEVDNFKGQIDYDLNEIRISRLTPGGVQRSDTDILQTFIHELLHGVYHTIGRSDICNDEGTIDGAANILAQAYLSSKE